VVGSVAPGLVRDPSHAVNLVRNPGALLIWSPARVYVGMPAIAVAVYVLPLAVIIEVLDSRYRIRNILVADISVVGIVVVRIVQVCVIVAVASVIGSWILIAVVIVTILARFRRIELRKDYI
jgi:hypothetical protein